MKIDRAEAGWRNRAMVYYSATVLAVNVASLALGRAYFVDPTGSPFWDSVGWIFLAGWMGAITLPPLVPWVADLGTTIGKRLNYMGHLSLATLGIAPICMFIASFLQGTSASNARGSALAIIYGSFFICTAVNCLFAFIMLRQSKIAQRAHYRKGTSGPAIPLGWKALIPRIGVAVIAALALGVMTYFAALSLVGSQLGVNSLGSAGVVNGVMGLVSGTYGWLFSIFAWHASAGGTMILRGLRRTRLAMGFGALGLVVGAILLAPMISTPLLAQDVDARFGDAFGDDWATRIPASALAYFKESHLTTVEYFLPPALGECTVLEDILYYNGSANGEDGLLLYFDAYLPPADMELPGGNSSLIRIHGGGWTIGDKGKGNMPLMNRYFASQGYCVFDIQYPLSSQSDFLSFARSITPDYVVGNYSIDDMVKHIGVFCQYLTLHQAEYHTNLSSVFVSGGSAGGHLTCVTALAIASGNYSPIFGTGMTIRGYIPFYPALHGSSFIDGGISREEFYEPISLVTAGSPPCLVYQGLQDGLVIPQTSQDLKDRYKELGNPGCQVIFLPFAGHGSDIDFYGYYNQFFLYYMERFMYLNR
jgi:acetyl esterase/lipase